MSPVRGGARQKGRPSPELRGGRARSAISRDAHSVETGEMTLGTRATTEEAGHNEVHDTGASNEDPSTSENSLGTEIPAEKTVVLGRPITLVVASRVELDVFAVNITDNGDPRDYIWNLT